MHKPAQIIHETTGSRRWSRFVTSCAVRELHHKTTACSVPCVHMQNAWNAVDWVALLLIIVGGINWGLVGLFDFNLVEALFGTNMVTSIIYSLVGLGAVYAIYSSTKVGRI